MTMEKDISDFSFSMDCPKGQIPNLYVRRRKTMNAHIVLRRRLLPAWILAVMLLHLFPVAGYAQETEAWLDPAMPVIGSHEEWPDLPQHAGAAEDLLWEVEDPAQETALGEAGRILEICPGNPENGLTIHRQIRTDTAPEEAERDLEMEIARKAEEMKAAGTELQTASKVLEIPEPVKTASVRMMKAESGSKADVIGGEEAALSIRNGEIKGLKTDLNAPEDVKKCLETDIPEKSAGGKSLSPETAGKHVEVDSVNDKLLQAENEAMHTEE